MGESEQRREDRRDEKRHREERREDKKSGEYFLLCNSIRYINPLSIGINILDRIALYEISKLLDKPCHSL